MPKKLTLSEKKLLNEYVTGETKRCLAVINRIMGGEAISTEHGIPALRNQLIEEILKGSPYIEYHPELLKRIPE